MTHQKGIPYGYISRVPAIHPLFPCYIPEMIRPQPDVLVNGHMTNCAEHMQAQLAANNYKYVVWHKPQPWSPWGYEKGSIGEAEAQTFIQEVFGDQPPIVDDETVRVYEVSSSTNPDEIPVQMGLDENWYEFEGDLRWAKSPAWLFVTTPKEIQANLDITPAMMFTPNADWHVGFEGVMLVRADNQLVDTLSIQADQLFSVPLTLSAGTHLITLELAAGNFRPSDYMETIDQRELGFATRSIQLNVAE
jgi:hypothetical protein